MPKTRLFKNHASCRITSPYGMREHPIQHTRRFHAGIDIVPDDGSIDEVIAHTEGTVKEATYGTSSGYHVIIQCSPSCFMTYMHLHNLMVSKGQFVKRGTVLGTMGATGAATGAHLHFQIEEGIRPVDPEPYLYLDYMEEDMDQKDFNKMHETAHREMANGSPPADQASVKGREYVLSQGIFTGRPTGMEWRSPVTRNELAIALQRQYDAISKLINK